MAEDRFSGVVQWFNNSKGFGFIKPDDGSDDLFVHHSSIRTDGFRSLQEGDRVEYSIATNGETKALHVTGPNGGPIRSGHDAFGSRGGACYECGESGHIARDCRRSGNAGGGSGGGGACYSCGGFGHRARDCVSSGGGGGGSTCFKCGQFGHMARDCSDGGNRGGGGGDGCYKCGEVGHMARNCSKDGEKSKCYSCGKPGHFARECVQASS